MPDPASGASARLHPAGGASASPTPFPAPLALTAKIYGRGIKRTADGIIYTEDNKIIAVHYAFYKPNGKKQRTVDQAETGLKVARKTLYQWRKQLPLAAGDVQTLPAGAVMTKTVAAIPARTDESNLEVFRTPAYTAPSTTSIRPDGLGPGAEVVDTTAAIHPGFVSPDLVEQLRKIDHAIGLTEAEKDHLAVRIDKDVGKAAEPFVSERVKIAVQTKLNSLDPGDRAPDLTSRREWYDDCLLVDPDIPASRTKGLTAEKQCGLLKHAFSDLKIATIQIIAPTISSALASLRVDVAALGTEMRHGMEDTREALGKVVGKLEDLISSRGNRDVELAALESSCSAVLTRVQTMRIGIGTTRSSSSSSSSSSSGSPNPTSSSTRLLLGSESITATATVAAPSSGVITTGKQRILVWPPTVVALWELWVKGEDGQQPLKDLDAQRDPFCTKDNSARTLMKRIRKIVNAVVELSGGDHARAGKVAAVMDEMRNRGDNQKELGLRSLSDILTKLTTNSDWMTGTRTKLGLV
ncbi:unnamed protein product [Tilletia controversa]|nr:unnamed protein product [Tilletia controversa]